MDLELSIQVASNRYRKYYSNFQRLLYAGGKNHFERL